MNIWLSDLEKQFLIAKAPGSESVKKKKQKAVVAKTTPKTEEEKPKLSKEEQERQRASSEAAWKEWRLAKDNEIKSAREKKRIADANEEALKNAEAVDQKVIDARFNAWKLAKKKQKQADKKKLLEQTEEYKKMMDELSIQRSAKIKDLQANTLRKNKWIERQRMRSAETAAKSPAKGIRPASIQTLSAHKERLESREWVSRGLLMDNKTPSMNHHPTNNNAEKHKGSTEKSTSRSGARERREARLQHQSSSYRADTLLQLQSWKTPTPEIYLLASILHKIVHYDMEESDSDTLIDVWRWLPWKIVSQSFQEELITRLSKLDIADMKSATIALLYVHCFKPHFKLSSIKKRSKVAAALRIWVNNVAGVHDIVDTHNHRVLPIDHLVRAGVQLQDVALAFLMTEVYPQVNFRSESEINDAHHHHVSKVLTPSSNKRANHHSRKAKNAPIYVNDTIVMYRVYNPPEDDEKLSSTINYVAESRRRSSVLSETAELMNRKRNLSGKGVGKSS